MNPGPVEEAGKVASGFMDAMKSQPLALAMTVTNFLLLGLFWYTIERVSSRGHEREVTLMQELSKCTARER